MYEDQRWLRVQDLSPVERLALHEAEKHHGAERAMGSHRAPADAVGLQVVPGEFVRIEV